MRNLRASLSPSARSRVRIHLGILKRNKRAIELKEKRKNTGRKEITVRSQGWKAVTKRLRGNSYGPSYPIQQVKGV